MNIKIFEPNFSYLEFGRNKVTQTESCTLILSTEEANRFKENYQSFITEFKQDDEQFGVTDEIVKELDYPSWERLINSKLSDFLVHVLNKYLFVEFFSQNFSPEGSFRICQVNSAILNGDLVILELGYTGK